MLAKLGYTSNLDDLEDWQLHAYIVIENTINKEREKDMKKSHK